MARLFGRLDLAGNVLADSGRKARRSATPDLQAGALEESAPAADSGLDEPSDADAEEPYSEEPTDEDSEEPAYQEPSAGDQLHEEEAGSSDGEDDTGESSFDPGGDGG
jgi:cobalamin biosynthesis protein CobT